MRPEEYPSKADFHISPYGDGSRHRVRVAYDTNDSPHWSEEIRIGDDYGISFPPEYAEAVIAAIRFCANALAARKEPTP